MEKFQITFALERPITSKKLKRAINDYYYFVPENTKNVKGNPIEEPDVDMDVINDGSTCFHVGTVVYKVFAKVKYKGTFAGYNPIRKSYHVIDEDDYSEDYYHNEVHDHQKRSLLVYDGYHKPKKIKLYHLQSKYTPQETDYEEHIMFLSVEIICAIVSLYHDTIDLSEDTITNEMIHIVISTPQSDSVIPEEHALEHFTHRKLRKLFTWNE